MNLNTLNLNRVPVMSIFILYKTNNFYKNINAYMQWLCY